MSNEDNTGSKLVASIRKTKTGTVASKTAEPPAGRQASARSRTATPRTASKVDANQAVVKSFGHGRRVWPD